MELRELIKAKDPDAWPAFECGQIDEHELYRRFFTDRRDIDGPRLKEALRAGYEWLPGIPELLNELKGRGVEMHTLSNYPEWYRMIEAKLQVSRWVHWSFVSCHTKVRKPDANAYLGAARSLARAPETLVFVDDRPINCRAAADVGMTSIVFRGAKHLQRALDDLG
jgi:HAD superfamily hydrolase (TIGR01509 family)